MYFSVELTGEVHFPLLPAVLPGQKALPTLLSGLALINSINLKCYYRSPSS